MFFKFKGTDFFLISQKKISLISLFLKQLDPSVVPTNKTSDQKSVPFGPSSFSTQIASDVI